MEKRARCVSRYDFLLLRRDLTHSSSDTHLSPAFNVVHLSAMLLAVEHRGSRFQMVTTEWKPQFFFMAHRCHWLRARGSLWLTPPCTE